MITPFPTAKLSRLLTLGVALATTITRLVVVLAVDSVVGVRMICALRFDARSGKRGQHPDSIEIFHFLHFS